MAERADPSTDPSRAPSLDVARFEALVREHVAAENDRDADRVRATYCAEPAFVDVPTATTLRGWPAIHAAYAERWQGFPTMQRVIDRIQTGPGGCHVEITMSGRHEGIYRGLPPTGDHHVLRICAHFAPADDGLIAVETAYYDALSAAVALGVLPDLSTPRGRLWLAMHRPGLLLRQLRGRLSR